MTTIIGPDLWNEIVTTAAQADWFDRVKMLNQALMFYKSLAGTIDGELFTHVNYAGELVVTYAEEDSIFRSYDIIMLKRMGDVILSSNKCDSYTEFYEWLIEQGQYRFALQKREARRLDTFKYEYTTYHRLLKAQKEIREYKKSIAEQLY